MKVKKILIISFSILLSSTLFADDIKELFEAIEKRNFEKVQELLETEIDISARNKKGQTPLHIAAANGDIKMLRLLMKKKPFITTDRFSLALPVVILVGLIFLTFSFYIGIIYSHNLAGPIYRIEKSILAMINGHRNFRVKLRKKDEFKKLAETFNLLMIYLKQSTSTLSELKVLISKYKKNKDPKYLEELEEILHKQLEDMEI